MKKFNRVLSAFLIIIMLCSVLVSCEFDINDFLGNNDENEDKIEVSEINIKNGEQIQLKVGETIQLEVDVSEEALPHLKWSTSSNNIHLSGGTVTALDEGVAVVIVSCGFVSDSITITIAAADDGNNDNDQGNTDNDNDQGNTDNDNDQGNTDNDQGNTDNDNNQGNTDNDQGNTDNDSTDPYGPDNDPYKNVSADEFYANYAPAVSYYDSYWRSYHGFMSGELGEQDQKPTISEYQPMYDGLYIRNSVGIYGDNGNSYTVVDAYGRPVMKVYRGGAYIMLEEVAAHFFAFGELTANHTASKNTKPTSSVWGKYLRVNHTKFSGDTSRYPYEPELPNISGCGGDLTYYELDIGTTGTDCDPSYTAAVYNNGTKITRGAARIVYTVYDKNGDRIIDINEKYLFYTYNHYNDFQEYLNYYGGWGEMFGNITGGGTISSKYNYNPTEYVRAVRMDISKLTACVVFDKYFLMVDNKVYA